MKLVNILLDCRTIQQYLGSLSNNRNHFLFSWIKIIFKTLIFYKFKSALQCMICNESIQEAESNENPYIDLLGEGVEKVSLLPF